MRPRSDRVVNQDRARPCWGLAAVMTAAGLAAGISGCAPDLVAADARSGADAKRSGAQALPVNTPRTDEVSFANGDRTDWYQVELRGRPGVLQTELHWDNESSDLMIDVFDAFGAQIAASPVRAKNQKRKRLLTQIDRPGTYFLRITAPGRKDGTVYTMQARWEEPPPAVVVVPSPAPARRETIIEPVEPRHPREPREPRERSSGHSVQGRIVGVYKEGGGLTLHLDKGSAAGLKVGMSGSVLVGPSGEDALDGGGFKITQVLSDTKSVARASISSVGRNTRFVVQVGR